MLQEFIAKLEKFLTIIYKGIYLMFVMKGKDWCHDLLLFALQVIISLKSLFLKALNSKQFTNSYDSLKYYGLIRTKNKKVLLLIKIMVFSLINLSVGCETGGYNPQPDQIRPLLRESLELQLGTEKHPGDPG